MTMDSSPAQTIDELERRFDNRFAKLQLQRNADMDEICSLL